MTTTGYESATWRRQVMRVLARDLKVSDALAARYAARMTNADLRQYPRSSVAIIRGRLAAIEDHACQN